MTPFDKCPVCGGEIVEKEVEKILRGGNLTEIVKAQAEVCLRCGERLYAPNVVKRFKKIRSKLQKEQMTSRQSTARGRLLDKLDYEVWLLDFLEKRYDMAKGKEDIPVLVIRSGEQPDRLERGSEEWVGSGAPILDAMMPFTFIASFKTLILRTVFGCRSFFEINKLDEAKCFIFNLGLHPEFDKKTGPSINHCFIEI